MSEKPRTLPFLAAAVACSLAAAPAVRAFEGRFVAAPAVAGPAAPADSGLEASSLASADFDGDGLPDLAAGYSGPEGGVLFLYRSVSEAIYPGPEASRRPDAAPFAATGVALSLPERPDFLAAGDFDGDSRADLVAAASGGHALYLLSGDGLGGFLPARGLPLGGPISALASGEFGRADGLPDLLVAIGGEPRTLLFGGAEGALRSAPETVALPSEVSAVAVGDLEGDGYGDGVLVAGSSLLTISGHPRQARQALFRESLDIEVSTISVGRSGATGRPEIRLAGPAGVRLLDREPDEGSPGRVVWTSTDLDSADPAPLPAAVRLPALQAGTAPRDLAGLDGVAALALRVNAHAASGLVVLGRRGELRVLAPAAGATLVVNTTATADARDGELSLREAILIANGTLAYASLTDGEKAQVSGTPASPGLDSIQFAIPGGGVPVIAGAPPQATDSVTIDGTTQPGGLVQITPPGSSSAPVLSIKGGGSLVRGMALNGNGNTGLTLDSSDNVVEGCLIGTNADGLAKSGTLSVAGIRVLSGANNKIGGATPAARNLVSGISGPGISILAATDTLVQGNFIGTDAAGTADLGSTGAGIHVAGGSGTTIGGTAAGARNLVSGNDAEGIRLDATNNLVQGNRVGTDVTGTIALGNKTAGIHSYFNNGPNTIGGGAPGAGNLASGNLGDGIELDNNAAADIVVQGNRIGTNAAGTTAVPNSGNGIHLVGIAATTIGGSASGAGNLISGNGAHGIFFDRFVNIMSTENAIRGNFIGTDVTGTTAIPNVLNGIQLIYAEGNQIGGTGAGEGNVISGNAGNGMWIERLSPVGHPDVIQGNRIGTNVFGNGSLGNAGSGVVFNTNTSGHVVGGTGAGEANTIAYNKRAGIAATYSYGLHQKPNRIFGNGGLGLDLLDDGVTANQPNRYDNFPVLTGATSAPAGTTVTGTLDSVANTALDVYFFSNPACDPSGYGEGRTYLGTTNVTTDASGKASFSKLLAPAVPGGQFVTAYAVAPGGTYPDQASEFSFCRLVEGPPEPPASTPLSLAVVVPSSGGNTALTTVRITGEGIRDGASVKLTQTGSPDIAAAAVLVDPAGGSVQAVLPLKDRPPGAWNVVVTNSGGSSATLPQAFEIRAGQGPRIWTQLLGPSKIVRGYPFVYRLVVGNRGDVDAHGAAVIVSGIPATATVQLLTPIVNPPLVSPPPAGLEDIPDVLTIGSEQYIPLMYPVIPPGETRIFSFVLNLPETGPFSFRIRTLEPMFGSPMHESWSDCFLAIAGLLSNFVPMVDCVMSLVQTGWDLYNLAIGESSPGSLAKTIAEGLLQCGEDLLETGIPILKVLEIGNILINAAEIYDNCPPRDDDDHVRPINVLGSWDPNGKGGPEGVAAARHLRPDDPLGYEIDFENKPDATAPARIVVITDQLDADRFDLSTFRFGSILVGSKLSDAPLPGPSEFTIDVDLRPGRTVIARVSGEVDRVSGLVTWRFLSIDPATGQPPANPLGGFLPPDTDPPAGRGAVFFQVELKSGLATGTPISNQATILFDANPPIQTPLWTNTVDATPPSSQVQPPALACPNFTVAWSGSDQGSGIATYSIFVSEDGGPFSAWLEGTTATSAPFAGAPGKTYGFYSIARDAVGNVEAAPASADATVTVTLSGPSVSSVAPDSGPASGGTSVTITGAGFSAGDTVSVGGVPATSVVVSSSTQITATIPSRPAGSLSDVVVASPGGCAGGLPKVWFADFADVPPSHLFHDAVEKIFRAGVTTGCGGANYCPGLSVTRDAMSVFILRGRNGSGFLPPPAIGGQFADVTASTFLARWIEWFGADGITTGCGNDNYCPTSSVSRAEMAVFLLRGKRGSDYQPPAATGTVFGDVTASTFLAKWMEQLKADGVTSGCGGGNFCPTGLVSRGEMAAFLARAFGL